MTYEPGAHSPCVLPGRVYYLVDGPWGASSSPGAEPSLALKARDVATDTLLWELPLATGDSAPPPLRQ